MSEGVRLSSRYGGFMTLHRLVASLAVIGMAFSLTSSVLASCGWSQVPSPNQGTLTSVNELQGVAADASDDAWAVGWWSANGSSTSTVVLHWNGVSWASLAGSSATGILYAAAASSPSDVWVVGTTKGGGAGPPLIEHWNGSTLTSFPTGVDYGSLVGVVALASNNVWAVGYSLQSSGLGLTAIVLHWNGTAWSIAGTPPLGSNASELAGIAATGPADVWASGVYEPSGQNAVLMEHFNGTAWSLVTTPSVPGDGAYLASVTAVSPTEAWAAGTQYANTVQPLVEEWNGKAWSIVATPPTGQIYSILSGVAASGLVPPFAAGFNNAGSPLGLLMQRVASSWSIIPVGDVRAAYDDQTTLVGAATVPGVAEGWVVGTTHGTFRTLAIHYTCGDARLRSHPRRS
jgi:hypothetical protein